MFWYVADTSIQMVKVTLFVNMPGTRERSSSEFATVLIFWPILGLLLGFFQLGCLLGFFQP